MYTSGLSTLEIKYIIERGLLPDHCVFSEHHGLLTLRVTSQQDPLISIVLPDLDFMDLSSSRAIAELIGDVRYRLAQASNHDIRRTVSKRMN